MKIYEKGKRILMATGKEEIELMRALLERARLNFPAGGKWKPEGQRLKNIVRELNRASKELRGGAKNG